MVSSGSQRLMLLGVPSFGSIQRISWFTFTMNLGKFLLFRLSANFSRRQVHFPTPQHPKSQLTNDTQFRVSSHKKFFKNSVFLLVVDLFDPIQVFLALLVFFPSVIGNVPQHLDHEFLFFVQILWQFVWMQKESQFSDSLLYLFFINDTRITQNTFSSHCLPLCKVIMCWYTQCWWKDVLNGA